MTDGFTCTDKETLLAYVYGECEAAERRLVEAHLAGCPACADEVTGLAAVRSALGAWTVTAPETGVRLTERAEPAAAPPAEPPASVLRPARWWQAPLPALGRLAAAILLFAGGAALANLEVRYDQGGFAIRTGWSRQAPAPAPEEAAAPAARDAAPPASVSEPWRADLASLERRLREEFGGTGQALPLQAAAPGPALDDRAVMARVNEMIAASEQRQQREMAYRISELLNELSAQRQNDLLRVQQGLGVLEGTTGAEVMRQRQLINYLLTTVSEKR
ncbi:MAG: zf-HC2 domain-containing protein [Acidobacteria bacterium]|nr:zf-HC2 domain-containing protein [Acidobacteriota bacterium]